LYPERPQQLDGNFSPAAHPRGPGRSAGQLGQIKIPELLLQPVITAWPGDNPDHAHQPSAIAYIKCFAAANMAVNLIGPAGVKPAGVAALWLGVIGGYQFHPDGKIQPRSRPGGVHRSAWHVALSLHNSGCILVDSLAAQRKLLDSHFVPL